MREEIRVPNGTKIKDIETGEKYIISKSNETNNQFGYGVYLYILEDTSIALWRSEFEIVNYPVEVLSNDTNPEKFKREYEALWIGNE